MIGIIDYGVGNLFSLTRSLSYLGIASRISGDAAELAQAERLILPGVGAFGAAMDKLEGSGLVSFIKVEAAKGKPLLGICVGMQLLFERSYEYGEHAGLGLIRGTVQPLRPRIAASLKVPHMGWNRLDIKRDDPIFAYNGLADYVYYVHSYFATDCEESVLASSEYQVEVTGVVKNGNIYGCQFHPEKSGNVGLALLKAFAEEVRADV